MIFFCHITKYHVTYDEMMTFIYYICLWSHKNGRVFSYVRASIYKQYPKLIKLILAYTKLQCSSSCNGQCIKLSGADVGCLEHWGQRANAF